MDTAHDVRPTGLVNLTERCSANTAAPPLLSPTRITYKESINHHSPPSMSCRTRERTGCYNNILYKTRHSAYSQAGYGSQHFFFTRVPTPKVQLFNYIYGTYTSHRTSTIYNY